MATPIPKNSCEFTLDEIASATGGTLFADGRIRTRGVSIDTRNLEAGALFFALRGNTDGHNYLRAASQHGAVAAIVERGRRDTSLACIEVDDTLVALGQLANHHLKRIRAVHPIPSISIGGAAGKTSTKEITAALAQAVFGATLSTPGNLNNRIGVPTTLLSLTKDHRAMVIECGTNLRGEISRLAAIVEPDVAMVLNVDLEHSEGLGTLENIADEEAAIFSSTKRAAIIPVDDSMLIPRVPSHLQTITFGPDENAFVRLMDRSITAQGRTSISIRIAPSMVIDGVEPTLRAELRMIGAAAAMNCVAALAAVASASRERLRFENLRAMEVALASIEAVPGRLATKEIGGIVIIDDSYNAQPPSVRIAIAAAREVADRLDARLVIVLGDMLELGDFTTSAHLEAVRQAIAARPAVFIAIGEATCSAAAELKEPGSEIRLCKDSVKAAQVATEIVRPGDVVIVKGSRGIQTERVVEALSAIRQPDLAS